MLERSKSPAAPAFHGSEECRVDCLVELAFPAFVGEGAIEIYRKDAAPELKLNTLKECVLPKNIEKPKQPNFQAPMMGGNMGIMGGATMVNPAAGFGTPSGINDISVEAADDIPF